ncbi:MAG TPA: cation diffusion facilitator family transporter [Candidatus Bathyarchaeia archaeon]
MANLVQGGKVAKRSFLVQLMVGLSELAMGIFTLSIALIADGIQSFADAGVSLMVWIGLRISRKAPDKRFHFGYHRVETLSSMAAALFMATIGGITLYESYREFLSPTAVADPQLAIVVALAAAFVSSLLLVYKRKAAKKYGSLALKTDASNSIKDVLTSITAFMGILLSSYFKIIQMDAIAGIIISLFVFTMVYPTLKEASLVLLDSYHSPETIAAIESIANSIKQVRQVHSIRMRKLGSYLIGDMHVVLSKDMTVEEAHSIASQIEDRTIKEFDEIIEMNVIIEPYQEPKVSV